MPRRRSARDDAFPPDDDLDEFDDDELEDDEDDDLDQEQQGAPAPAGAPSRAQGRRRAVAERLRALVAGGPSAPVDRYGPAPYPLGHAEGIALQTWARNRQFESRVQRTREAPGLSASCTCPKGPRCEHVASLVGSVASIVERGQSSFDAFVDGVEPPSFEEKLEAIDALIGRVAPPEHPADGSRLRLRLSFTGSAPRLELVQQKPRKKGGWSSGRTLSPYSLWGLSSRDPAEAWLLSVAGTFPGEQHRLAVLLESRRHPGLVIDEAGSPVEIATGTYGVAVVEHEGGWRAMPAIDGLPLTDTAIAEVPGGLVARQSGRVFAARVADELARLLLRLARDPIVAPPELAPLLVARFSKLEPHAPLALPPALAGREVPRDDRTVLVMEPLALGATVKLGVRPLPGGPLCMPGEGAVELSALVSGERVRVRRELDEERRRAADAVRALALAPDDEGTATLGDEDVLSLLERVREPPLDALVVLEWPKDFRPPEVARAGELRVRVTALADWFGVEGGLEVDGALVELAKLLDAAHDGRRFVAVGAGRYVGIERLFQGRLAQLADLARPTRRGLELSRHAAAVAPELFEGEEIVAPLDWRELLGRARRARSLEPRLPSGLRAELREYQVDGFRWMRRLAELGAGAVLADDMGLGKTVQAIAVLLDRAEHGPQLVVAPTSVGFNWARELGRFAPGLRCVSFREGDRRRTIESAGPGDVVVASYGLVRMDDGLLAGRRWATLVLDEAHAVKTWQSATAKAVRAIEADWRLALTGTPLENHLGELWSLVQTICPGLLGGWEEFSRTFAVPIEKHRSEARRRALSRLLRPFVLRRTKAEVLRELPPRTEVRLDAVLSKTERALYEAARLDAIEKLAKGAAGEDGRFEVLAALTRLRQLASHARMVVPAAPAESAKLAVLREALEEALDEGHRCLVFSQFVTHLGLIREALEARGLAPLQLDGSTPAAERGRIVDRFQRGEAPVLLVSLKAGGTGLNLTAADTVFLMDPWWNPAVEDQAADRAHRIGQTRPVTVVRIVAKGTVEEKVLQLHERKRELVAGVLDGSDASAKLSTSELVDLLQAAPAALEADLEEGDDEATPATATAPEKPRATDPATAAGDGWDALLEAFRRTLTALAPKTRDVYVGAARGLVRDRPCRAPADELAAALGAIAPDPVKGAAIARFLRFLHANATLERAQGERLEALLRARVQARR